MKHNGLLAGVVLAGGQARRMQAGPSSTRVDKGLLMLNGEPLVQHAVRVLQAHTPHIFLSANQHVSTYAAYGTVLEDDHMLRNSGPLAGVATALAVCEQAWLMVLPVDVVNLPEDLVPRLFEGAQGSALGVAHARVSGQEQPLCAIIHRSREAALRDWLLSGGRAARHWLGENASTLVDFSPTPLGFYNINTPEDLWRAHLNTPCSAQGRSGGQA